MGILDEIREEIQNRKVPILGVGVNDDRVVEIIFQKILQIERVFDSISDIKIPVSIYSAIACYNSFPTKGFYAKRDDINRFASLIERHYFKVARKKDRTIPSQTFESHVEKLEKSG